MADRLCYAAKKDSRAKAPVSLAIAEKFCATFEKFPYIKWYIRKTEANP
jgi:hypothetical protein